MQKDYYKILGVNKGASKDEIKKAFYKMAHKQKFKPGQHFILDQTASTIIMKNKIKTYLIGKNLKEFENFLKNKKFKGTIIGED